jgi:hypothetical protein
MIHAWKQKGVNHEVYPGIACDGKPEVRLPCGPAGS